MMGSLSKLSFLSLGALALVVNAAEIPTIDPETAVPNSFLIVMNDDISDEDFEAHQSWVSQIHTENATRLDLGFDGTPKHTFSRLLKGYSGLFDEGAIREIAGTETVSYIEPDTTMSAFALETQTDAPSWGLGRISHQEAGSGDYVYDSTAGEGVTVYDVDTGVDISHPEFEDRATWGSNQVDNDDTDGNGHGTHVGGTMVGKTFGIAKKANIVAVKVLDAQGSGTTSDIVAGMEWATEDATSNGDPAKSVMNMSLGGQKTEALNQAAAAVVEAGIFLAVAAGNEAQDAENVSPASEPTVCTVGATDDADAKAEFSNFGSVLDIFAPGVDISSAQPGGGQDTLSGTSMASPHIAGLGAYFIALDGVSGGAVCDHIIENANAVVQNPGQGTTEDLAYNNSGE